MICKCRCGCNEPRSLTSVVCTKCFVLTMDGSKLHNIPVRPVGAMKAYLDATGHDRRPPDPRVMERINNR